MNSTSYFIILLGKEFPTGPLIGTFFALSTIAIAMQTYKTYKAGYMYCGRTERAYRKDDIGSYRFWFAVQIGFSLMLAVFALLTFFS